MWVLTLYSEDSIKMFEYDNKEDAKRKYDNLSGNKILSEVIYFTDFPEVDLMHEQKLSFAVNGM